MQAKGSSIPAVHACATPTQPYFHTASHVHPPPPRHHLTISPLPSHPTPQVEAALQRVLSRHGRLDGVASLVGDVTAGSAAATIVERFKQVGGGDGGFVCGGGRGKGLPSGTGRGM